MNPQAVNEPGFDVFTDNKRAILYMTHSQSNAPVAFVAIGAMLVRDPSQTCDHERVLVRAEANRGSRRSSRSGASCGRRTRATP